MILPVVVEAILIQIREFERWGRVRGGESERIASAGIADAGRVLNAIRSLQIETVDDLVARDGRRAGDGGLSLGDFGVALRAMADDVSYAVCHEWDMDAERCSA